MHIYLEFMFVWKVSMYTHDANPVSCQPQSKNHSQAKDKGIWIPIWWNRCRKYSANWLTTYMFVIGDYSDYWQYTMIMVAHVLICCLASWLKSFAAPSKLRRSWAPYAWTGEGIGGCWQCHLPISLPQGVQTRHQDALFWGKAKGYSGC